MRRLTICLPYYLNAGMLERQVANLESLPSQLSDQIELIVVDDGSPVPAVLKTRIKSRLYRMKEDIPWNQDACRNLAVSEADEGWLLLTDMDHLPTEGLLKRVLTSSLQAETIYTFRRVTAPDMTAYKPHPNSWLMTRATYMKTGGYDERFRGVYGTDGAFSRAVKKTGPVVELKDALVRYPREVIPDASTTTLVRKSDENERLRRALREEIKASGDDAPKWGLTPWERVS